MGTKWMTSSRCAADKPQCVEVQIGHDFVAVRDSKHPRQLALTFDHAEWAAFLAGVKAGEFDLDADALLSAASGLVSAANAANGITPTGIFA